MKTEHLYNTKYFSGSRKFQKNASRLTKMADKVLRTNPTKILDVGCGIGYLVLELRRRGFDATGLDFSKDLTINYWSAPFFVCGQAKDIPFPDGTFDVVTSSDFFEHIPEEEIDTVLSEMKRVGKKIIAFVAVDIGETLTDRQKMYHCTHKPMEWWVEKLKGVEIYDSHKY